MTIDRPRSGRMTRTEFALTHTQIFRPPRISVRRSVAGWLRHFIILNLKWYTIPFFARVGQTVTDSFELTQLRTG